MIGHRHRHCGKDHRDDRSTGQVTITHDPQVRTFAEGLKSRREVDDQRAVNGGESDTSVTSDDEGDEDGEQQQQGTDGTHGGVLLGDLDARPAALPGRAGASMLWWCGSRVGF